MAEEIQEEHLLEEKLADLTETYRQKNPDESLRYTTVGDPDKQIILIGIGDIDDATRYATIKVLTSDFWFEDPGKMFPELNRASGKKKRRKSS